MDGYTQTEETYVENFADGCLIEMKKIAPFAQPSQYDGDYFNSVTGWTKGGSLMLSLHRKGSGMKVSIESYMPYAIRRNYENNLNPQTTHYIERGIDNVMRGQTSRWWQAERK